MKKEKITNLYFFRHGESIANINGLVQSHDPAYDSRMPLTYQGMRQISAIIPILKKKRLNVMFSSDLYRAHQGAALICIDLHIPVYLDPRLRERGFGSMAGKTKEEAAEKFPDFRKAFIDPDLPFFDGETTNQLRARVTASICEMVDRFPGKNIGVASHGGSIASFLDPLRSEGVSLSHAEIAHVRHHPARGLSFVRMYSKF